MLHSIFGFTNIFSGKITVNGRDVTSLTPSQKLSQAGIAYILQDKSVFPGMTVEENLLMGGFLKNKPAEAKAAAEMVFDKYSRLADRRDKPAGVLSGGERRLLEISRALVMNPDVLLVDEPSIGLEPRFIDMVFEIPMISSAVMARPSSWLNRTPRRVSISLISAMCWFPVKRHSPMRARSCSPIRRSGVCSSAVDQPIIILITVSITPPPKARANAV